MDRGWRGNHFGGGSGHYGYGPGVGVAQQGPFMYPGMGSSNMGGEIGGGQDYGGMSRARNNFRGSSGS